MASGKVALGGWWLRQPTAGVVRTKRSRDRLRDLLGRAPNCGIVYLRPQTHSEAKARREANGSSLCVDHQRRWFRVKLFGCTDASQSYGSTIWELVEEDVQRRSDVELTQRFLKSLGDLLSSPNSTSHSGR